MQQLPLRLLLVASQRSCSEQIKRLALDMMRTGKKASSRTRTGSGKCSSTFCNLIDRIQIGYVVDFIDWHVNGYHWPTFNIADVSISVGVGLMIIDMIRQTMRELREAKALRQQEPVEKTEDAS